MTPRLLIAWAALRVLLSPLPAFAQDYDHFSEVEMANYRHFQLDLIGNQPTLESFEAGYAFILPLYTELPESEAYRICYAQAISGFPATPANAALHVRGLEALAGFDPAELAASGHMGILLMNLMERLSEDRAIVAGAAMSSAVRRAFLGADAVAASVFAFSLKKGIWHQLEAGSEDWTFRPGMTERRDRLDDLSPEEKAGLPDWRAIAPEAWLTEAALALGVLKPVLRDPESYRQAPADTSSNAPAAGRASPRTSP